MLATSHLVRLLGREVECLGLTKSMARKTTRRGLTLSSSRMESVGSVGPLSTNGKIRSAPLGVEDSPRLGLFCLAICTVVGQSRFMFFHTRLPGNGGIAAIWPRFHVFLCPPVYIQRLNQVSLSPASPNCDPELPPPAQSGGGTDMGNGRHLADVSGHWLASFTSKVRYFPLTCQTGRS